MKGIGIVSLAVLWLTGLAASIPHEKPAQHFQFGRKVRGGFAVEQRHNKAYSRNGPSEYAWALRKHGKDFDSLLSSKIISGPVAAVNQTYDREYLSPVYIGTPGQLTWIDLDTGSADLWLFSSDTPAFALGEQKIYQPRNSSTSKLIANATWHIVYGDASSASGTAYRDTVSLGNLTLVNATVQSATTVSRSLTIEDNMSGLMGLALNHSSTVVPKQPTILDSMAPLLDQNLFGVDLRYHDTGAYHFGYINESVYTGDIEWRDVEPDSGFWQFNMETIHIGNDTEWRMHSWPMITDTGTTLMLLPPDLTELYWRHVPGARMNEEYFGWVFPCNATLPNLDFGFADKWNATIPGHYINYTNITETECFGGIQDSMEDFGIVGDVFMKALYVVHDMDKSRVGFAKKPL